MRKFFTPLFILLALACVAQPSVTYYNAAEGKTDESLKTALYGIISSGYVSKSYDFLYTIYETSDRTASGNVWDMYSTCTWEFGKKKCGNYSIICDCQNREHSIPQSWFGSKSPMVSDAFHVYPTDGKVNGIRSSYPFGETNALPIGGKALGKLGSSSFPGYSGTVFEPIDEYKGDFARTYFYFATRYENIMTTIGGESFNRTKYPSFPTWAINLFLKWHRNDPVSQKEIDRNEAIYAYQKNRNPFIDYPELAEYIWGTKKGTPWTKDVSTEPHIINPADKSTIDFGNIPYQQNFPTIVTIQAANLTGDLSINLSGVTASFFTLSTNTITKAQAEVGYKLIISCNPQVLGVVTAVLNISGGGIIPAAVNLKATSTDSFMATAATGVEGDKFTANWTTSANASSYLLNVYSYKVTGTQAETIFEEGFNSGLPISWVKNEGFVDDLDGEIRLASGSQNGIITTPELDLSSNTILYVRAKQYGSDTGAAIEIKIDSEVLTTITTGKEYETHTVQIPETSSRSTITFTVLKNKRVYIDNVRISTEGALESLESLAGYPKNVGNILSYQVTGLQPDSIYYYTVTPQGNGALVSNEIQVKTIAPTGTDDIYDNPELLAYFAGSTLYVSNLEVGSKLSIYSVLGNKILETTVNSDQISLPFTYKGIFILQTTNNNRVTGTRKMILH